MTGFDHFNIYFALNEEDFQIIDSTVGTAYYFNYNFAQQTSYKFYITTVNQSEVESEPSAIVEYVTTANDPAEIPLVTALAGNYPNPFNPSTTICFSTADPDMPTRISIYNLKGQKVADLINEILPPGEHSITWNGKNNSLQDSASGLYLLIMDSGKYHAAHKILLMK
jgi:hypothetical protein